MSLRILPVVCFVLLFSPVVYLGYKAASVPEMTVQIWSGNKSAARQEYERAVLQAAMEATRAEYGAWQLREDSRGLPAADEAGVFRTHRFDVVATVAGNAMLANEAKRIIPIPLMNDILGYRLLIIRSSEQDAFSAINAAEDLQAFTLGIPAASADAERFRLNGFRVDERGSFEDLFTRQLARDFDYAAFGINDIERVFTQRAEPAGDLALEQSLLLYYPLPVVFYVNPTKTLLTQRLTEGLQIIKASGELNRLVRETYGDLDARLGLHERQLIRLHNPFLPPELADYRVDLGRLIDTAK